jgi:hypothetical protein
MYFLWNDFKLKNFYIKLCCCFFKDAKSLMQDALNVAGTRPESIITDGLYHYAAAINKVMGWQHYTYKKN